MISGSAALLLQSHPGFDPLSIKALLMNTAETNIQTNPVAQPGVLAPITRIGSGEVRVNRAFASTTAAWNSEDRTPSLSFGYNALNNPKDFDKNVEVHNYASSPRKYSIAAGFRYASDAASGAVSFNVPSSIDVPPHGQASFTVHMKVDADKLPIWTLNGGNRGGDGFRLQDFEFDGYITISDPADTVHLPWHVLPHRAAKVKAAPGNVNLDKQGTASVNLQNQDGAVDGRVEVFSLTGESKKIPPNQLPGPGDNFAVVDLNAVGTRLVSTGAGPAVQFGINTFGTRSHPNYPAEFDIYVDSNRNGEPDFVIFNVENGGFAATGQNVVAVANLATGSATIFFFADADLDSGNIILTAPLSALGLTPNSTFDFSVYAFDNYFTGNLTDAIENMTYTPATPRYVASGVPSTGVPAGGKSTLNIQAVTGGDAASPSQLGFLLLYRDAQPQNEADTIEVKK
jgi:hypothetical protein